MNNLKKVMALVIVLSMLVSMFTVMTASAADFEDVIGTDYEEAVMVLAPMGVIAGYEEDGVVTFKPSQVVTRAEMASFIIRELGLNVASHSNTVFSDVPYDFWGSGAISIANSKNIIVGHGDGTFGPDDQVSFQDAVKMLVCALGYEVDANDNGGYPAGYIAIADKLDLLEGLTDKLADTTAGCDRGTVANLMYNALNVYLQEVTWYNGQVLTKTITSSTMASEMGYTKFENVVVNATSTTALSGSLQDTGYVALSGVKEDVRDGGYNMDQYLGRTITVYASYDRNNAEYTIVSVVGETGRSETIQLDLDDVQGMNGNELVYYVDKESSSRTSSYTLAPLAIDGGNLTMVYNNTAVSAEDQDFSMITDANNGSVTLIDSEKDGIYERVIIETYKNYQVVEVITEDNLLYLQNSATDEEDEVELDDSRETNRPKFSIVNTAGESMVLEDLAEDDIVSIYSDVYPAEEAAGKDYVSGAESLRIIVSTDTIEGTVTSISSSKVYIDGEAYETDGVLATNSFAIDDEGIFFLDFNGYIAASDTSAVLDNFDFVYDGIVNGRQITLYTMNSDGEKVSYDMASTVRVDGQSYSMSNSEQRAALADVLKIDDGDGLTTQYIVSLRTNESGDINRITMLDGETESGYFTRNDKVLGNYILSDDTIVFTMPSPSEAIFDEDEVKVVRYSTLQNQKTYSFKVCDVDKNGVVTAVIVYTSDSAVDADSDIAVIQSVSTTRDPSNETDIVLNLTMIQGGQVVTKHTKTDDQFFISSAYEEMYGGSAAIAYGAYPGQIIMYSTDSTGAISNTFRLYPRPTTAEEYEANPQYYLTDKFQTWDNNPDRVNNSARLYIGAGFVTDKNTSTSVITVDSDSTVEGAPTTFIANYGSGARVIVVDTSMASEELAVKVGSSSDIRKGDYVVVRKYRGTVEDIVVYKNFEPAPAFYE